MPQLSAHQSAKCQKMLVLGPSGSGKTGLLGSLANADYRLFIMDFDNGLDILLDPKVVLPEKRGNIYFKTFTDKLKDKGIPDGMPQAVPQALNVLNAWVEDGVNLGSPYSWGEKDVLVIDSLTMFGVACLRYSLAMAGRSGKQPQMQDWGEAIRIQESLVEQLYSDAVKCNVVVNAHLTFADDTSQPGMQRAFPSALGAKLPPRIGRYFNSMVAVEKQVSGSTITRVMRTQATFNMELKNPRPSVIPPVMEPDLAKFFALLRS